MANGAATGGISPDTLNTLVFLLAGAGSEIAGNQGVPGFLGKTTQDLVRAQNFQKLLQGGTGGTNKTQNQNQATTTPKTPAPLDKNKITFEGSKLEDITSALSGMSFKSPEIPAVGGGFGSLSSPEDIMKALSGLGGQGNVGSGGTADFLLPR